LPTPPFWLKIIIFIPVSFVGYAARTFRHSMVRTAYPTMLPYLHPSNVSDGVANPAQPQSKRCTSDLPGFKNLEGLYVACFSPNDSPQTLAHKNERSGAGTMHAFFYLSWL